MKETSLLQLSIDQNTKLALLDKEHTDEFMALIDRSRPYLRKWLAWPDNTKTVTELNKFIDHTILDYAEKKSIAMWIWHQEKIVGIIHLLGIAGDNRKATIGYWVGEEYRGRGFAKRATRTVCDYAFRELKINSIQILCATGNSASQAVPMALNFQREGVLRDNEWLYDHFVDHVVFGMLAKDWA